MGMISRVPPVTLMFAGDDLTSNASAVAVVVTS